MEVKMIVFSFYFLKMHTRVGLYYICYILTADTSKISREFFFLTIKVLNHIASFAVCVLYIICIKLQKLHSSFPKISMSYINHI